mmetsp:Transcript_23171/g.87712  ORF Transcript_23171/g.87712 Transcript_23171/m.87712 type:complete len:219 (-) Transcript_23171:270-926(-)
MLPAEPLPLPWPPPPPPPPSDTASAASKGASAWAASATPAEARYRTMTSKYIESMSAERSAVATSGSEPGRVMSISPNAAAKSSTTSGSSPAAARRGTAPACSPTSLSYTACADVASGRVLGRATADGEEELVSQPAAAEPGGGIAGAAAAAAAAAAGALGDGAEAARLPTPLAAAAPPALLPLAEGSLGPRIGCTSRGGVRTFPWDMCRSSAHSQPR